MALVFGCDDSSTSGDDDGGMSGNPSDASADDGGGAQSGGGGRDDGGSGSSGSGAHGAHQGSGGAGAGDDDDDDDNAGSGAGGSSGAGSGGVSGNTDAGATDAGDTDSGVDSGMDAAEPDPDPTGCGNLVECVGVCCTAGEVCKTQAPTQIAVDFPNAGNGTRNVVVGSTVTFNWDAGDDHNVQLFPNQGAHAACNFDDATLLSENRGYVWTAPAAGAFYFGCSLFDHCAEDGMRLHVVVTAPTQGCGTP